MPRGSTMYTHHIGKRTSRQWKRAISSDYVTSDWIHDQYPGSFDKLMEQYLKPVYKEYSEVFNTFDNYSGTVCISPEFWIKKAQGRCVLGYLKHTIGTCTRTDMLLNPGLEFLVEELQQIGGTYATVRINGGQ